MQCRCHGVSGSCQMKTCWKTAPMFKRVAELIKQKFLEAVKVDTANTVEVRLRSRRKRKKLLETDYTGPPHLLLKKASKNKKTKTTKARGGNGPSSNLPVNDLIYTEKSPSFCEPSSELGLHGTKERQCNSTTGGCDKLCCGRGYTFVAQTTKKRCRCQFKWCCSVVCQTCFSKQWVAVCK